MVCTECELLKIMTFCKKVSLPIICKECEANVENYLSISSDDGITYIDRSGKHLNINTDIELDVLIDKTTEQELGLEADEPTDAE